jgi:hypothetical protein
MAIWQHQMHLLPREEVVSYLEKSTSMSYEALNEIDWWKYGRFILMDFEPFESILPRNKSWSDNLALFGEDDSTCIEILFMESKVSEISIRIDLRKDNDFFLEKLCEFAKVNNCVFLDENLFIINSDIFSIKQSISRDNKYERFLNKLG